MTISYVDVDVRPTLRAGGEPFGEIMAAVSALKPGNGLRLIATFKPTPLFSVMAKKGYSHTEKELGGGDWEVLFTPGNAVPLDAPAAVADTGDSVWPAPVQHLDNRELDPPEPMVKILATVEKLAPGQVISAFLCREPAFLFPELAKRGHSWRGGFEADGTTYKVLVRAGAAKAAKS